MSLKKMEMIKLKMYDIIAKKRDGKSLNKDEITFWITNYIKGLIPDYQSSALLMAIFINGMKKEETAALTMAMVNSGERLNLSNIKGIKVDKHSTGGIGDKTSLVLVPLVAAAGVPIAKMAGRGLGYTGGTIDKLESIPGFNSQLNNSEFINNIKTIGLAITGQTNNLVPADKKLYALRDVTATVNNIPLIASSIMSKKIASGADAIVLDVKVGNGAFMKDFDTGLSLAKEMLTIAESLNLKTSAIISDMNQPLGYNIGNSLEVIEAIETLKGRGPQDLIDLCMTLGSHMLLLAEKCINKEEAKNILKDKLSSGEALNKFKNLLAIQGGDIRIIDNYNILPTTKYKLKIESISKGYIKSINTEDIGKAALIAGAGRETIESIIDLGAGIVLNKKIGDKVNIGETLAIIHINKLDNFDDINKLILSSFNISGLKVQTNKLIYKEIIS